MHRVLVMTKVDPGLFVRWGVASRQAFLLIVCACTDVGYVNIDST